MLFKQVRAALVMLMLSSGSIAAPVELFAVNYPPYMMVTEDGPVSGIDVEVTVAAFRAVGVPVKISTAPWKRVLKNMEHGRVAGALSCSRRPEREPFIHFSDPVSEANQVMISHKSTRLPETVELPDLTRFSVVAVEGWAIQKELVKAGIPHTAVPDIASGINAVVFRNIDIFYNGELTTLHQAQQMDLQDQIRSQRFTNKPSTPFHLCLSKGYPDSAELLEQFNRGLQLIKASGEYQQIYDRYLNPGEHR